MSITSSVHFYSATPSNVLIEVLHTRVDLGSVETVLTAPVPVVRNTGSRTLVEWILHDVDQAALDSGVRIQRFQEGVKA